MARVFTIAEGLENMGALKTGGQGSVYKARRTGPLITAVKLLPTPIYSESADDKNFTAFLNEVQKLKKVNEQPNPNVVKILNSGISESGSFPFIEMEFIEGPDLEDLLKPPHDPVFTVKETVKLAEQLSNALAHCHKLDVKHGDIKSNNVKFNKHTGNYVLLDFGLAVMSDEQRRTSLRHAGAIEFMAPEQNEGAMLFQTDVYSFGVILYELLAGRVPFTLQDKGETSRNSVMVAHLEKPPPDLLELRKTNLPPTWSEMKRESEMNLPQWLVSCIYKCLQKKPQDRFLNGVELYEYISLNSTLTANRNEGTGDYVRLLQSENGKLLEEKEQLQKLLIQYQQNPGSSKEMEGLKRSILEKDRELQALRVESGNQRYVAPRNGISKSSFYALLLITICLGALAAYGFWFKRDTNLLQSSLQSDTSSTTAAANRTVIAQYKVEAPKAFFHNEPDAATRRNAYLIPSENALINALDDVNEFIYTEFTNTRGQVSKGWLKKQDLIGLEEWTRRENTPKVLTAADISNQLQKAKVFVNDNNLPEALAIYKSLSDQQVPEAMYYYGDLALRNKNAEIDCRTAIELVKNASDKKYTPAKRTLGFLYLFAENRAVLQINNYHHCTYDKDILKGSKLLMEAVLQGDSTAKKMLEELNIPQGAQDDTTGQ
ncbi:MAG TPA: protein kinase [Chitinophagaceae bacterium]|nr:protein kinase [Chitinophagaceae bacterium]